MPVPPWTIPIVAALPGFFLWAVVHEGAHAAVGAASGLRVVAFKPWPHRTAAGQFVFAGVSFRHEPGPAVHVAPFVVDAVAAAGAAVGFWFVASPIAAWGLATLAALPTVDLTVGVLGQFRGVNPTTDLARVPWGAAVPFLFAALAAWSSAGAMLARLFS